MSEKTYTNAEGIIPSRENPFVHDLVHSGEVKKKAPPVRGKNGWATRSERLRDPETGELLGGALCLEHKTPVPDRGQFVKVFTRGIRATFGIKKRAQAALTALLEQYADEPMDRGGRNDMVLFDQETAEEYGWKASRTTFRSAMNELCLAGFLCPVRGSSDLYWTNPTFFHKGDRLVIVNHYVLDEAIPITATPCGDPGQDQMDFDGVTERDRANGRGPVREEDVTY